MDTHLSIYVQLLLFYFVLNSNEKDKIKELTGKWLLQKENMTEKILKTRQRKTKQKNSFLIELINL